MLKIIFSSLTAALRNLFGSAPLLGMFLLLYVALLLSIYGFLVLRESSILQLIGTSLLTLLIPVLFFVLQAAGVTPGNASRNSGDFWGTAFKNFWKLLLVSIPVILLAWLVEWLLAKIDVTTGAAIRESVRRTTRNGAEPSAINWLAAVVTTVRFLLLYLLLPLTAIQLWIAAVRENFFGNIGYALMRAFSPRSWLTYLMGMLFFAVIPYFLFFTRTPIKSAWVEMVVFGARLALAFLFILFGWVITLSALSKQAEESIQNESNISPVVLNEGAVQI
jgi:hypothetical protein